MPEMKDEDLCSLFETIERYVDLDSVMLVGARARDIHQLKYRNAPPVRTTNDVDLALAVSGWGPLQAMRETYPSPIDEWQKLQIGSLPVDVVPFGGLENPPGKVPAGDGFLMNVAGLEEAFESCEIHTLSNGVRIKIPSVPGFAALKLHAWLDRHPEGKYKDAKDLALILAWYEGDLETLFDEFDKVYDDDIVGEPDRMAAKVLGSHVAELLGSNGTEILVDRFREETEANLRKFADNLWVDGEWLHPFERRELQVHDLVSGLVGPR